MTKLTNRVEYNNNFFKAEFAEYLLSNGFRVQAPLKNVIYAEDKNKRLEIIDDRINFYTLNPEDPTIVVIYYSFYGFGRFNIFEWMLLLHITGTLTLKDFLSNAAMGGDQLATETKFLIDNLFNGLVNSVQIRPAMEAYNFVRDNITSCNQTQFESVENLLQNFRTKYPEELELIKDLTALFEFKKNPTLCLQ